MLSEPQGHMQTKLAQTTDQDFPLKLFNAGIQAIACNNTKDREWHSF